MPKRKPTALPKSEPLEKLPPVPVALKKKKHASNFWNRVGAELTKINALTGLHLETFELLCRLWHDYKSACDWEDENPKDCYYQPPKGYITEHPRIRNKHKSIDNFLKLLPKFGLTPEALTKLGTKDKSVAKKQPKNPVRDFAAKKRCKDS